MRSMLVIGAGNFGQNLAIKLSELNNEVMVVDMDEDRVQKLEPYVTRVQIGDCLDIEVLEELGVSNFDVCFVCISHNFQSSLEITSFLKELGARRVVSKSDHNVHADLLKKIGADEVIYPERDMAERTAFRYSAKGAFDYIQLTDQYAIMEIETPPAWVGKNLLELNIRHRYQVNVIGIREGGHVLPVVSPDHLFTSEEHIFVVGSEVALMNVLREE